MLFKLSYWSIQWLSGKVEQSALILKSSPRTFSIEKLTLIVLGEHFNNADWSASTSQMLLKLSY